MMGRLLPLRRVNGTTDELSDEGLLGACERDDTAALGALFDRYQAAVFNFLMRYLGPSHPDIDDLVQGTFIEVQRSASKYRGTSSVRTWILGIATNLARHHLRGETRRRGMLQSVAHQPLRPLQRPDDDSERRQLVARLHLAITQLPADLRGPLVLCDMEELTGSEAARILGVREGTLWRRLYEARMTLREQIERSAG